MNPDDPKFTAHALGEFDDLTPAERAEIEALLAADSNAASEAEEMKALAARLRAELPGEEAGVLNPEQRAAVFSAVTEAEAGASVIAFPHRRWKWALGIAACLAVAGSAAFLLLPTRDGKVAPSSIAVTAQPAQKPTDAMMPVSAPAMNLASTDPASAAPPEIVPSLHPTELAPAAVALETKLPSAPVVALVPPSDKPVAPALFGEPPMPSSPAPAATAPAKVPGGARDTASGNDLVVKPVLMAQSMSDAELRQTIALESRIVSAQQGGASMPAIRAAAAQASKDFPPVFTTPTASTRASTVSDARVIEGFNYVPSNPDGGYFRDLYDPERDSAVSFEMLTENGFLRAGPSPLSTFSIDVDTASYAMVRRFLTENRQPPKGAVRIEELINYFSYDYPQPEGDVPFSAAMEVAGCPWKPEHRLVRIGLKGREMANDRRPASNLVFLIDVSGSMRPENKLPLLKRSLGMLIDQLGKEDQVAMVVYAGTSGCVLEATSDKAKMRAALSRLEAGGSTNGGSGVQLAYRLAEKSFIKGGTNRVILATDGDWNVGVTNRGDLLDLIKRKAQSGVFLTVLGLGMDNLKDSMLVKLADSGNGNYAFLDTDLEARKVLIEQLSGTLVTIAKDVKIQVEFNPAQVSSYRLVGYEKRMLKKEDFSDDKKDAGEIGAGHTVTALYEVVPVGQETAPVAPVKERLKYQSETGEESAQSGQRKNDPGDLFVKAYMSVQVGEKAEQAGNLDLALEKYLNAERILKQIAAQGPEWQPQILVYRADRTATSIARVKKKLARSNTQAEQNPEQPSTAPVGEQLKYPPETGAEPGPSGQIKGNPSDRFVDAYTTVQTGEKAELAGDLDLALVKYSSAEIMLKQIAEQWPEWQPQVMQYRMKRTTAAIAAVKEKMAWSNAAGDKDATQPSASPEPATPSPGPAPAVKPAVDVQPIVAEAAPAKEPSKEMLTLKIRYKDPEGDTSKLLEFPLTDGANTWQQSSTDFRFAAAVAGYGMLLRDSAYKGELTWNGVTEWAQEGKGKDSSGYRAEFLSLVEKARAVCR